MALTMEQKVDFIYQVALKLAQEHQCLPVSAIWTYQYELTSEDLDRAEQALSPLIVRASQGSEISYRDLEKTLVKHGWSEVTARAILGILYADGNSSIMHLLNGMPNVPSDVKRMMKKAHY
jgi:hypothetical protein